MTANPASLASTRTFTPAEIAAGQAALAALRAELKAKFIERDDEIDAVLTALVAEEHVLLLGPWGTAKSNLANALQQALACKEFSVLLTKHTTPEEVFGPFNLPLLKQGKYERVTTGRFPEAELAFLDEIFKSSSAILNAFLTALNERWFDNGGIRQAIPLTVCIAASNELPQDEGLGALFDRFLIRRWTRYISDRDNMRRLLLSGEIVITSRISQDELLALRAARRAADFSNMIESLLTIKDEMGAAGLEVSDRRWKKVVKLVQASAVMHGRSKATTEDLIPCADALWDDPDDHSKVYGLVARAVSPDLEKALQLMDAATDVWTKAGASKADLAKPDELSKMAAVNNELKRIVAELKKLKQVGAVAEATAKVLGMHTDLARRIQKQLTGSW